MESWATLTMPKFYSTRGNQLLQDTPDSFLSPKRFEMTRGDTSSLFESSLGELDELLWTFVSLTLKLLSHPWIAFESLHGILNNLNFWMSIPQGEVDSSRIHQAPSWILSFLGNNDRRCSWDGAERRFCEGSQTVGWLSSFEDRDGSHSEDGSSNASALPPVDSSSWCWDERREIYRFISKSRQWWRMNCVRKCVLTGRTAWNAPGQMQWGWTSEDSTLMRFEPQWTQQTWQSWRSQLCLRLKSFWTALQAFDASRDDKLDKLT
jgi:hypothetical protein